MNATVASRHECKYLLDPHTVPLIRDFIRPFVRPDKHARPEHDFRYTISSLYFDSADFLTYRQTMAGEKNRFKLRIRIYDDAPHAPAFLEVKNRVDRILMKDRTQVTVAQAERYVRALLNPGGPDNTPDAMIPSPFAQRVSKINARPVARVRFSREAYEAADNSPVRITFDNDVHHQISLNADFRINGGTWTRTSFEQNTILEVKFTEIFPGWVRALIDQFQLMRQSIPKYVQSVDDAMANGGLDATFRG